MKLAVRGDQLEALSEGQGREEPHDQLVGVRCERDLVRRVVEQPRKPTPYLDGFVKRLFPHIVYEFSGIKPRLLLRLERYIGPCLMGVPGEEDSLRDPKACVVLGELFWLDHNSE